jgi:hypothetical protein
MAKKFYETDTCGQFNKTLWHNLCYYQHIDSSFECAYAAKGVNNIQKSFMKLIPVANFIQLFGHNLNSYQHIFSSFECGYAAKGVNNIQKSFMKLTPDPYLPSVIESIVKTLHIKNQLEGVQNTCVKCYQQFTTVAYSRCKVTPFATATGFNVILQFSSQIFTEI